MTDHYKNVTECRVCGSGELTEVVHIPEQHLSPTFVETNENNVLAELKVTQTLMLCDKSKNSDACGLLQLKETVNPDLLYREYFYRTAINDTMKNDLRGVVSETLEKANLIDGDVVIDIGANDCTMLSFFPENLQRIGVEPAQNIDWSDVDFSISVVNDYFSKNALDEHIGDEVKAKAITACAMFYDLDDPNSFVADVKQVLDPEGVWCIQLSYLPLMLENINFYDICNEHLEYYSLSTLDNLMQRHGLKIYDASTNNVNGGSVRVFISHVERDLPQSENLRELVQKERQMNLDSPQVYFDFNEQINELRTKIVDSIFSEIEQGGLVVGLGASTKGNMLLQTFGITKEHLPYISERNPKKVGLRTLGTDIELISEEHARSLDPSCMLVMPWYFKDEIVQREQKYIENGGKLLFPMPYPHVVHKGGETNL